MNIPEAKALKTMLILKSQASRLTKTESFLRNRGWEVYSTSDLKEALIQVVSKKHAYVLISIDHPNNKIPMLPKLIREKYDVAVISFAESTSASSFNSLTESPTEYKIYAPVTGPAVERCINKYLKDCETLNKLQARSNEAMDALAQLKRMQTEEEAELSSVFVSGKKHLRQGFGTVHHPQSKGLRSQRMDELKQASDSNDSLIARATHNSLAANVDVLDGFVLHKIEETTLPSCIMIESNRFSGYLVAALGKNQKIEENLIQKIQMALFSFLKENGEEISDHETLSLKLKQVDFEPWALEYAEFMKTTVHQGSEMAMAFFPRKPLAARFEDSDHPDMMKIKLQDLQGDRQLEFNLYMHLKTNNKFILYTPKGGVFYTKQLDRLKKQGVTHMHVQKDAVGAISQYHAQNYLNDLIEDFEERQRYFNTPQAI